MRSHFGIWSFSGAWILVLGAFLLGLHSTYSASSPPVTVSETAEALSLSNGILSARIEKRTGTLVSLTYNDLELLAQRQSGANGGYWSSVGRGRPGSHISGVIRINPATNSGARAEISCELHSDPESPNSPVDADYRYSLGRGEHWLYVYSVLHHKPGYPAFGVGEARYCLKLNPEVFDYMTIDKDRYRIMPSGYDWDHGEPLNLKEARRMSTGVHKGEPEHKYDYSAVFSETPAYGWSSTKHLVGLWMINPSLEYIGGGPTKAELTGHLDVNPGGLPTLLNMWVGSHYGGTSLSVATNESWTKVVGPFVLYCNTVSPVGRASPRAAQNADTTETTPRTFAARGDARPTDSQMALWHDALAHANAESNLWPYPWLADSNYPNASERATVSGQLILHDPFSPNLKMSNIWVGVAAPDYTPPPRFGSGFRPGFGRTNLNFAPNAFWRGGFPPQVDWQRDAKFYQFWTRADPRGRFKIPNVRAGNYTLHAIADGVLGEFTLTNLTVVAAEKKSLGKLQWSPVHYGHPVWQIGIPDRTAREFRHGDHYWQWGLYFDYPKEFTNDVNFIVGKSDWRKDWNFVQPPRIETRNVAVVGEDDEQNETAPRQPRFGGRDVRSTKWSITFTTPEAPHGKATLRLAFCGTHVGCNVEALANDKSIGETGPLPSTSAMQRDGIRAYWIEKDISFDASFLNQGTNVIKLLSHADSWSQGVMYDCVRLELDDPKSKP